MSSASADRPDAPKWVPLYFVLLLAATLSPLVPARSAQPFSAEFVTRDSALNVVLFVPLGLAMRGRPALAALASLVLSAALEWTQQWLTRQPAVSDVLANTAGGALGALLPAPTSALVGRLERAARWTLPVLALGAVASALVLARRVRPMDFSEWDEYPLAFGSDEEGEPAWGGSLERIAVYDRVVAADGPLFEEGEPPAWSSGGPVLSIDFRGPPAARLDGPSGARLVPLAPPADAGFTVDAEGLRMTGHRWELPAETAAHVLHRVKESGRISVAARLGPDPAPHPGRSRIFSMSCGWNRRDFALMQVGPDALLLVRNPDFGPDAKGPLASLPSADAAVDVLGTCDPHWCRLFVAGDLDAEWFLAPRGAPFPLGSGVSFTVAVSAALASLAAAALVPRDRLRTAAMVAAGAASWTALLLGGAWAHFPTDPAIMAVPAAAAVAATLPLAPRLAPDDSRRTAR